MQTAIVVNFIAVVITFLSQYRKLRYCYCIVPILLTIVYGIRYGYGNDYWNYYEVFINCSSGFDPEIIEPGWGLINVICQPIGFFGMIFILTAIENYVVFRLIKEYVPNEYRWLAVFIFVFTFNFMLLGCSMMRQYFAMIILLTSIPHVVNRNFIRFLLILALAISIHKTAIIFLPVYLLAIKIPKVRDWKLIAAFAAVFIILLATAVKYVEYFEIAAILFADEKFNRYLMWDGGSFSFTIIIDLLLMIILMYYCKGTILSQILCVISLISYIILPFTFVVAILLRLMLFFSIFFIFSIPNMMSLIKNKLLKYGILCIYIFITTHRSIVTMTGETYGDFYDTYQTILSAPSWM